MPTMTISLPEPLRQFIESEVSSGNYGSASELFREMVRERQKNRAQEKIEALLLEGLESGKRIAVTEEYIEQNRKKLLKQFAERNKK